MWCGHCQQDVPAIAASTAGAVQCARCRRSLERPRLAAVADSGIDLEADGGDASRPTTEATPIEALHSAETRAWRRQVDQTLRAARRRSAPSRPSTPLLRFDPAEAQPRQRANPPLERLDARPPARPVRDANQGGQLIAWLIALTGATALGAGLGLVGWSLLGARPDLWNWGLFATLGGQGLLVVGLTLLLASLWTNARGATGRLTAIQNEILRLQRSTEALTGDRTASATRFYADLARGASPELLVANLRGQLDELSASMAAE